VKAEEVLVLGARESHQEQTNSAVMSPKKEKAQREKANGYSHPIS
jgi:hypothetical protein